MKMASIYVSTYNVLLSEYGKQHWWPAQTEFEMICGAVLTQNAAWRNVEMALNNLGRDITPRRILDMPSKVLEEAIRPSGYYRQKALRLKIAARWVLNNPREILETKETRQIREDLLALNGFGRETVDSILLYALNRRQFVIDAYTRRLFSRLGANPPDSYDGLAECFHAKLPPDIGLYNEYHALIVRHCKDVCTKHNPKCEACPLENICPRIGLPDK